MVGPPRSSTHAWPPTLAKLFAENGIVEVFDPERIGFFFDHSVIVPDARMASLVKQARQFATELGVQIFDRGTGISHVLALEQGWFRPGNIVLGSDSHTCTGGAVQSLGLGMGASDIAAAMVTGKTWLKVPETIWLNVHGSPHPAVGPKDVLLFILNSVSDTELLYKSVQWTGSWVEQLSLDGAATLASMAVEMGAKCAFLPDGAGRPEGMVPLDHIDGGKIIDIDISDLVPQVAVPHAPSNVRPLNEVAGQKIDYVFLGSCTNSRLEDIELFTEVLAGRQIFPGVHCIVTPGSRSVYLQAVQMGYVSRLVEAGVLVTPPGCGACVGTQGTIPAKDEHVLSTMNRNFKGRMGNPDAHIWLSSPWLRRMLHFLGGYQRCRRLSEVFDEDLRARILPGGISTDDIIPARYKHMYTDPKDMAPHVFEARFPKLAVTFQPADAIIAQGIFGIGSSREQAVSSLLACGIKAVIAPAFGRIFFRNAWNLGLIAIEAPTEAFNDLQAFRLDLKGGCFVAENALPTFSPPAPRMLDMIAAGGLLPYVLHRASVTEKHHG